LRIRPSNRRAILTEQDNLPAALAEFHAALTIDPSRAPVTLAAERALQQSLATGPSSVEARYDLGSIEAALGKRAASLGPFDAALRLDPHYVPARAARDAIAASPK
jgi:tetratricopeptide (TPR) repeat protein